MGTAVFRLETPAGIGAGRRGTCCGATRGRPRQLGSAATRTGTAGVQMLECRCGEVSRHPNGGGSDCQRSRGGWKRWPRGGRRDSPSHPSARGTAHDPRARAHTCMHRAGRGRMRRHHPNRFCRFEARGDAPTRTGRLRPPEHLPHENGLVVHHASAPFGTSAIRPPPAQMTFLPFRNAKMALSMGRKYSPPRGKKRPRARAQRPCSCTTPVLGDEAEQEPSWAP